MGKRIRSGAAGENIGDKITRSAELLVRRCLKLVNDAAPSPIGLNVEHIRSVSGQENDAVVCANSIDKKLLLPSLIILVNDKVAASRMGEMGHVNPVAQLYVGDYAVPGAGKLQRGKKNSPHLSQVPDSVCAPMRPSVSPQRAQV